MKKTQIAGIAAVALLSLAPAASAAITNTTSQASLLSDVFTNTSDVNTQISNLTSTINGLPDQTYNESNPMPIATEFNAIAGDSDTGRGVTPVQFSSFIVAVNSGMDDAATSALANTKVQKLKVYVTSPSGSAALKKAITKAYTKGNGNSFSFTITVKNGDNAIATKTLKYTNNTKIAVTDDDSSSSSNAGSGTTTTTPGGLSNVTELTGNHSVSLAGPSGFVYTLFSMSGTKSNRGLAGETAWFTDKTATDANGNLYYRVSTDEWVEASSNVTFN
ncbi:hypothetical protein [Companilactobacillus ginsenosidimutans]|uniref:Surface layer protein A domain-containing protein n=1 Tax=Companilactobacillus ginsenosidimutans TaxID=1007676 RepID=A0A0H4QL08_9LACO|nr:hypothetical protein [Companilactobacillus ginsenosidimutans]AKP67791.1 hypothetical protein ABM34_09775 [Companilactobacillus ginsenosidimutans]